MKFVLTSAYPIAGGAVLIPEGTTLDGNDPQWRGVRFQLPMPLCAKAMDQAGYDHLVAAHAYRTDSLSGIQFDTSAVRPAKRMLDGRILSHQDQQKEI
jgi:hypothetical protein